MITEEQKREQIMERLLTLCGGNPGAASVLTRLLEQSPQLFESAGPLIANAAPPDLVHILESSGLRGPGIWIIWKDYCRMNLARFVSVLLALEIGILQKSLLAEAAQDRMERAEGFSPEEIWKAVRFICPWFDMKDTGAST